MRVVTYIPYVRCLRKSGRCGQVRTVRWSLCSCQHWLFNLKHSPDAGYRSQIFSRRESPYALWYVCSTHAKSVCLTPGPAFLLRFSARRVVSDASSPVAVVPDALEHPKFRQVKRPGTGHYIICRRVAVAVMRERRTLNLSMVMVRVLMNMPRHLEASISRRSASSQARGTHRPLAACTYSPRAARTLADSQASAARLRRIRAPKAYSRRMGGAERVGHHPTRGRDSGARRASGESGPCHESEAGAVDVVATSNYANAFTTGSTATASRLGIDAH